MAGSSDCIISLSRWQKLMARITPKTVTSPGATVALAGVSSTAVMANSGGTPER